MNKNTFNSVMIVDDDTSSLLLIANSLKKIGYSDILTFDDPEKALEFLKTTTIYPELLLVDYTMPRMNGVTFIEEAKKINNEFSAYIVTSTPEAVVLTGKSYPIVEKHSHCFNSLMKYLSISQD